MINGRYESFGRMWAATIRAVLVAAVLAVVLVVAAALAEAYWPLILTMTTLAYTDS